MGLWRNLFLSDPKFLFWKGTGSSFFCIDPQCLGLDIFLQDLQTFMGTEENFLHIDPHKRLFATYFLLVTFTVGQNNRADHITLSLCLKKNPRLRGSTDRGLLILQLFSILAPNTGSFLLNTCQSYHNIL